MKKLIALLLTLIMVMSFAACGNTGATEPNNESTDEATTGTEEATTGEDVAVMTYEEYMAAATDAKVCVETYVQANQSWWYDDEAGHGKVTIYAQDADGAYFAYEVNCTEEDAAKLIPGTKIRITGDKAEWAGEIEIMNGTVEFVEGGEPYVAEAIDATELLGTDALKDKMNQLVTFNGMTFKSLSYKDSEWDKDIYVTLTLGETDYEFCVENYLTGPDTDLYKAVEALAEGDVVNVTGFLYWYEGPNTHITAVEKAA